MFSVPPPRGLETKHVGEVLVVRLAAADLADEPTINALGKRISALVDRMHRPGVVVNLAGSGPVASALIAKLVGLARRVRSAGGRVALGGLNACLFEKVVEILKLSGLFEVYETEEEAVEGLRGK